MKPTFHHRLVNGPFDDPCLYVRLFWEKRALLFDAGDIGALDYGDMLKVSDVFVTHTHIDHFIGFDTLLRAQLRSERPLRIYGPEEIISHVEGKLRGYTWNLIEEYPIKLEVFGIGSETIRHASFHASESFRRIDRDEKPFDGLVLEEELFRVRAVNLRHDIQCLGYTLEEDYHINIDKDALEQRDLPVGPWLSELKRLVKTNAPNDAMVDVGRRTVPLGELKDITMTTDGQKLSYVMDAEPTEENVEKIIGLARDSSTLYCEAYFMDEDMEMARQRHHLTAGLAGRIARRAGVKELVVTHFSPRYTTTERSPAQEAAEEFGTLG